MKYGMANSYEIIHMFDIDSVNVLSWTPGCNPSLRSNKSVPSCSSQYEVQYKCEYCTSHLHCTSHYVYFQIDLEKLEDVRNRVKVKKRQRQKYD